jgi:uncharacterized membrane protein
MPRYGYFGHGPTVFGWLFLALLVALVVLGAMALVRSWRGLGFAHHFADPRVPPGPHADPALGELRVRYARGDITWEDFVQRAVNLGYPPPPGGPTPVAPNPAAPTPGTPTPGTPTRVSARSPAGSPPAPSGPTPMPGSGGSGSS